MFRLLEGVAVTVYTSGNRLTQDGVDALIAQCPSLTVLHTRAFHDRFIILDGEAAYHIGASLKDAGKVLRHRPHPGQGADGDARREAGASRRASNEIVAVLRHPMS